MKVMGNEITSKNIQAFAIAAAPPVLAAAFGFVAKAFTDVDPVAVGGSVLGLGFAGMVPILESRYKDFNHGCTVFTSALVLSGAVVAAPYLFSEDAPEVVAPQQAQSVAVIEGYSRPTQHIPS